jgi:hypothetical protein
MHFSFHKNVPSVLVLPGATLILALHCMGILIETNISFYIKGCN